MKKKIIISLCSILLFLICDCYAQDALNKARASHFCIRVRDFDATIKWYTEKLNFRIVQKWKAPHIDSLADFAYINFNGFMIEVIGGGKVNNYIPPAKTVLEEFSNYGYRHLCFDVDNVDAVFIELRNKGVDILREPATNKIIQKRILLIQDNNGLVIEFAQDLNTSK